MADHARPALAPLPDLAGCWALVTGATTGYGRALACSCVRVGLGVVLTDGMQGAALRALEAELRSFAPDGSARVAVLQVDMADPAKGARTLHRRVQEQGYDVAVLLIASDQVSYTGPFLAQPLEQLDQMLALNVGFTSCICRLFGEDMKTAGRGRILLVGAPAGASPGLAGACAFTGSMAFVRALTDGLQQELEPVVGVSCLESCSVGREASLGEALTSTCVSFLAPQSAAEGTLSGAVGAHSSSSFDPKDMDAIDWDRISWSRTAWTEAYVELAREKNFRVLPFGAEIDALQRSSLAEFSNALLVGLVCIIYVLNSMPKISPSTKLVLSSVNDAATALFALDYLARWWSRGLRWDYLLKVTMICDLLSVMPFLLRGVVPALNGIELNFLKLFRVLWIYRYFKPDEIKKVMRAFLGPGLAREADLLLRSVRPVQLQIARTFGILSTLLFVTAALIFEAERGANPQFKDFFDSLYYSIIALSTAGFGDYAPVTPAGKTITSICLIIGLCIIPFQASYIAEALAEEVRLEEQRLLTPKADSADAVLSLLAQSRSKSAWDAARIAELEKVAERARVERLKAEEQERLKRVRWATWRRGPAPGPRVKSNESAEGTYP